MEMKVFRRTDVMQHFMKQLLKYFAFLLIAFSSKAQISGTIMDEFPLPGVTAKIENYTLETISDLDDYYSLDLPKNTEKIDLVFDGRSFRTILTLEILGVNIKNYPKFKLDVSLPTLKNVSVIEYKNLTENEKHNYKHVFIACYSPIDAYVSDKLDKNYILLNFENREYKICDFKLDMEKRRITINWFL